MGFDRETSGEFPNVMVLSVIIGNARSHSRIHTKEYGQGTPSVTYVSLPIYMISHIYYPPSERKDIWSMVVSVNSRDIPGGVGRSIS